MMRRGKAERGESWRRKGGGREGERWGREGERMGRDRERGRKRFGLDYGWCRGEGD